MTVTRDQILDELKRLTLPDGGNLVSRDMVRALSVDGPQVRFVIEAPDPATARKMEAIRAAAEELVQALPGVEKASAALTAHEGKPTGAPAQRTGGAGRRGQCPQPEDRWPPEAPDRADEAGGHQACPGHRLRQGWGG